MIQGISGNGNTLDSKSKNKGSTPLSPVLTNTRSRRQIEVCHSHAERQ